MVLEDACRFTVGLAGGAAGGGGGGGGAWGAGFLHAALRARIASKLPNRILACVRFRIFLLLPPLTIYVSFGAECKYEFEPFNICGSESPFWPLSALFGRPLGRFILSSLGQLTGLRPVSQHGLNLSRSRSRGFEHQMTPVRGPDGP